MERINRILKHPLFLESLEKNQAAEEGRRFCRHGLEHFLDVARIGCIINYEEQTGLEKEWIYAAALLHDIGKYVQYADGTPHEQASAQIAPEILKDCGFGEEERAAVLEAILSHREKGVAEEKNLRGVLYRADKASRACFGCAAEADCDWKGDKKNFTLLY